MGGSAVHGWLSGRRACALAAAIALTMAGGCALLIHAKFAPKRLETLILIEERTGWNFPAQTRIVVAAQDNLGLDFALWAVLEVPRDAVREVLMQPQTGQFASDEGEDGFPEVCQHMSGTYWASAPDWIPPLPSGFDRYLGVSRFEPKSYDVREAIVEMGDDESAMATVYVLYTTY